MTWEIKQMTMDVEGLGRYEIAWQPGTGGYSLMLHTHRVSMLPTPTYHTNTVAIDDRDIDGNSIDWDSLDDAKAACGWHVELSRQIGPWKAADEAWLALRKEAQAEEAANRWDASDYLGGGL